MMIPLPPAENELIAKRRMIAPAPSWTSGR